MAGEPAPREKVLLSFRDPSLFARTARRPFLICCVVLGMHATIYAPTGTGEGRLLLERGLGFLETSGLISNVPEHSVWTVKKSQAMLFFFSFFFFASLHAIFNVCLIQRDVS